MSFRHQEGQTSAKTICASFGGESPVSNGQISAPSAQPGSSRNSRTTGIPVSDWLPTEPVYASFQQGCAPTIQQSISRFSASPPTAWRLWCFGPRNSCLKRTGQPQNGNEPLETRRLNSAATVKRSFWLFSASLRQEAISSHTARHGGAAFSPSRCAKPAG